MGIYKSLVFSYDDVQSIVHSQDHDSVKQLSSFDVVTPISSVIILPEVTLVVTSDYFGV